jgi:hypothetical protein
VILKDIAIASSPNDRLPCQIPFGKNQLKSQEDIQAQDIYKKRE